MGSDQYHEPPDTLSEEARTFARVSASLTEEVQAIGWYQQRLDVETDDQAKRIMLHAQREEFRHFCMDLEFLMRRSEDWAEAAHDILFKPGPIGDSGADDQEEQGEGEEEKSQRFRPWAI